MLDNSGIVPGRHHGTGGEGGVRVYCGSGGPADIRNTKIHCGLFQTGLHFPDRKQYFGCLF